MLADYYGANNLRGTGHMDVLPLTVQSLPEQQRSPKPPWDPLFPGAFFMRRASFAQLMWAARMSRFTTTDRKSVV